jgi:hypothetical protein
MNVRGVALQGTLAAVGLVAAFLTWQREPEGLPGEVTVLDISKRALQKVRYDDANRFVELSRDPQDEETIWVLLGDKPRPPPPAAPVADGGVPDGGVASGTADGGTPLATVAGAADAGGPPAQAMLPPPQPPRQLRGNQMAEALLDRLAPLKGTRALGELDAKKLEELGLVNSPRKLTLTVGGREQILTLVNVNAGWSIPYAMREDGRVFLLGPAILPDFEGALNRLIDRRQHTFDQYEPDSFTLTQGKNTRTFVLSGKPPAPVNVAPKEAPDKPDEFVRNWYDRIWRVVPTDVLGRGEEPPGGSPEELFRLEYRKGDKLLGHLVLARAGKNEFFVRTEHTAGWMKVHSAMDTLLGEATKIASGG